MPHWPKKIVKQVNNTDLSRMEAILAELGNPHLYIPKTIHIAGTNGKGSTCAMLKSIFETSGYKVHLYTSPHLLEFNERIIISGNQIPDDYLFQYLEEVRNACININIEATFFEATTAAAFLAFSRNDADILILETGMGGRLDPTNVIKNPILTIITSISYDHMEYLGPEISLIAREKAGIIKKNAKCIISRQDQKVMDILLEKCDELQVESIAYEYDFIPEKQDVGFQFLSILGDIYVPALGLLGNHQIINSSSVISTIFALKSEFNISNENLLLGLKNTKWLGRLEEVNIKKIVNNTNAKCYIDGAHNIGGAAAISDWVIQSNFKNIVIIVGLTKNRDVISILSQFNDLKPTILSVPVLSELNSYSAKQISEIASKANINVIPQDSLYEAIEYGSTCLNNPTIIITGSLFLIADFYKLKSSHN